MGRNNERNPARATDGGLATPIYVEYDIVLNDVDARSDWRARVWQVEPAPHPFGPLGARSIVFSKVFNKPRRRADSRVLEEGRPDLEQLSRIKQYRPSGMTVEIAPV
jgi:hypothetical protein